MSRGTGDYGCRRYLRNALVRTLTSGDDSPLLMLSFEGEIQMCYGRSGDRLYVTVLTPCVLNELMALTTIVILNHPKRGTSRCMRG